MVKEYYIYSGTKRLRCGYTTGSCATASAKASAQMLLSGKKTDRAEIVTPSGISLEIGVCDCELNENYASCAVVKDSGDDPDITNGIKIYTKVFKIPCGIEIVGGEGIGKVTKAGLDQPIGEYAINSVPRKTISEAVMQTARLYGYEGGLRIIVSVPDGEKIAEKTFNPRLGITGGISIIGTTGIVEPMSNSAVMETIRTEVNIQREQGRKSLLLTVGNYSEKFIDENKPELKERCVMCSNFIGDSIDIGISLGFENILIYGHIGKMAKLGSGIMNTHSSYADGRMETLITCGVLAGVENSVLCSLNECATVDSALDILFENGSAEKVLDVLTDRIHGYLQARTKGTAKAGAVIFSYKSDILLKTAYADEILKKIAEE